MEVNALTWVLTVAVLIGIICFDFFMHVKRPHEPSMKEASLWMLFYFGLTCLFALFLWLSWGGPEGHHQHGIEFFAGYITELSLSVDNLFIFALIIGSFQVPRAYQQKVLLIGIAVALILRGLFIGLGAAVIAAASWVFYLFGAFLLYTAVKLVIDEITGVEETNVDEMAVVRLARKAFPVSGSFDGDKLFTKKNGKKMATPLLVCLISIGFIDLMFAFDSIPAIFGLTQEGYIVFTANCFALMGLRQMYFLLDGLLDKLVYLPYGLGVILGFIGVKLIVHALHENNLPLINGGKSIHVWEIPTHVSLIVIVATLVMTTIASVIKTKRDEAQGAIAPDWNPAKKTLPSSRVK